MYLGLDIGTSSVKGVLIDGKQKIVATATVAAQGVAAASRLVGAGSRTLVEGLQHRGEGACQGRSRRRWPRSKASAFPASSMARPCSTRPDKVLRPAILWNDARSFAECTRDRGARARARDITGNIPLAGFTAPKLVWVKKHEPRVFDKVAKVLLPKDYVRLRMTGEYASDMSDSSGTSGSISTSAPGRTRCSRRPTCRATRCRSSIEGTDATGRLTPRRLPRPGACRSARWSPAAAATMPAAACGIGAVKPGARLRLARHLGRAFRLQRAFHAQCGARRPRLLPCRARHLAPDGRDPLGRGEPRMAGRACSRRRRRSSRRRSATSVDGPSPALFLPYLSGERTPVADAQIRGACHGPRPRDRCEDA